MPKKEKDYVEYLDQYFKDANPATGQDLLKRLAGDLLGVLSLLNTPAMNAPEDEKKKEETREDKELANSLYADLNNYSDLSKEQIESAKSLIKKYLKK